MASLRTLLGVVLCSFMVSSSEILPQADFDLQAMAGKWYRTGICSNGQWFVSHKANMKTGTAIIKPTEDGGLEFSFSSLINDTCQKMENLANKTEVPGKFTFESLYWGVSDMRMVDVKYDEYALTYSFNTRGNETFVINRLFGRSLDLSDEVQEKFRQFCLQTGILPENTVLLPKSEECPLA
ncbi:lipocalin-like [Neolamprologus brichardi]|uniref:Zgc:153704 n=1 Tax=Neolamprologus brichardi TaxID=32507 RepID=A0A3Q4I5Z9_NEOBR|nr:lipocalin-like [Neolamprologus brichardi]